MQDIQRFHWRSLGVALLLVLAPSLQRADPALRAQPAVWPSRTAAGTVRLVPLAGRLDIDGAGMSVRITRQPWRLDVFTDRGHLLVQGDENVGVPTFLLASARPVQLSPAGQPNPVGAAAGLLAVHLRRLLPQWHVFPGGATVRVATDDPLRRVATVTVRLMAPGVVQVSARLGIGSRWPDRGVVAAMVGLRSGPDEHFFGLGEQFGGVDARGRRVGMLVQDGITTDRPLGGYAPVPFFVSSRGYGFYLAGSRPSVFALDVGGAPTWQVTVSSAAPTWYVLDGPRPPDVIARYADLTGHPPMPPPWTLGVWKTLVGGRDRVLAAARRLRAEHIPVSVIWTYDAVDEGVGLGWPFPVFAPIEMGTYPDLPDFTAALHRLGYRVLGYVSPEFTPGRASFTYPARHGYFVRSLDNAGGASHARAPGGRIFLLDLTNQSAVRWWQGNLRRILATAGFDGWFQDLGDRLPPGALFANGRGALDMANLYPLLYARTAEAVARASKPDALLVMRSGVAGIQRYQRAVWAGDQRMTWDRETGFPAVIPAGLSWGIAQAPFWGSDIGGYLEGRPPLSRAAQEELYLRWVEFGAFSPIMRDTLGDKGRHAVYMDSDARTLDTFRFYAQLHQQLFPYLYAAARTAHLSGLPIMRHLFLAYPDDPQVYGLDDEYLLGPDLLVAPVTVQGARTRSVYLPAGTWVDYWSGAQREGSRWVTVAAPLARIPLFVRGGALLPLLADPGDTLAPAADPAVQRPGNSLLLRLFPGGAGGSTVLADGTALAYDADARGLNLRITSTVPRLYRVEMSLDRAPSIVRLNRRALPRLAATAASETGGWSYDAAHAILLITVRVAGGQIAVS